MTFILLIIILAVAVFYDIHSRRIPNILTLGGILAGLALNVIFGGWHGFSQSFWGLAVMTFVGGLFWVSRLIGGADHKLLMATAAFVGYPLAIPLMATVAIVGGLQALIWIIAARVKGDIKSLPALLKTVRLPYSVSIAIGAATVIFLANISVI